MLLNILAIAAIIIASFIIYVAMKPSEMVISRELLMNATPANLFPYLNNSKKMNDWMPWADEDPGVQMIYSGPAEGVGSTSSWDSKGKMGTGNAVIVESVINRSVKTQLTYQKPMQMSQLAEMTLTPSTNGTIVSWSVTGEHKFIGRLFCVFVNMDKMVGGNFEKGLAKLKTLVEH